MIVTISRRFPAVSRYTPRDWGRSVWSQLNVRKKQFPVWCQLIERKKTVPGVLSRASTQYSEVPLKPSVEHQLTHEDYFASDCPEMPSWGPRLVAIGPGRGGGRMGVRRRGKGVSCPIEIDLILLEPIWFLQRMAMIFAIFSFSYKLAIPPLKMLQIHYRACTFSIFLLSAPLLVSVVII